jgi:hypothetical protein
MPFDLQPRLQGELLELRPLCAEDFRALYAPHAKAAEQVKRLLSEKP